ncbi:MAG: hypothetical protein ACR2JY_22145 [Chloroflexota bacterium]
MATVVEPIDIGDNPDLLRLVEDIRASNSPRVLRHDNEDVAIIRPLKRAARTRLPRGRPAAADDPLWQLIGVGVSDGPGDVSTKKHYFLAEAYADRHK